MRSRSVLLAGLPLAAVACGGNDTGTPVLEPVTDTAPQRVEVVSTVGVGEVVLVARTVNSYRVAVPSGALQVSASGDAIEGGSTTQTLEPGPTGIAHLRLPSAGAGTATWSVDSSDDGLDIVDASTQLWSVDLAMSGWAAGAAALFLGKMRIRR